MILQAANTQHPNLTFPSVIIGNNETAWDLTFLLYRGGAKALTKRANGLITSGKLGNLIGDRLTLVVRIHEAIETKLRAGGSSYTAHNSISSIRAMFAWAESSNHRLDLESIQSTYLAWTDFLLHRNQILKNLSQVSAYTIGAAAGYVLDDVLNRSVSLISTTRLRMPLRRKTAIGRAAEKQNLEETFKFGHFLQDICDALSASVVMTAPLPIIIPLRHGGELVEWSNFPSRALEYHLSNQPSVSKKGRVRSTHRRCLAHFKAWESDGTSRTRYPLINRRIEAELLIFIAQTGMNFAQAHKLKLRQFTYSSHIDGYRVRDRKSRRNGEVLFEIFREYKPHFERYLEWRRQLFPDSDAVFPFIRKGRAFEKHPQFRLRATCKKIGLRFIPPQELRSTRINWLLRHSEDPDLTAAMAQHHKETLLGTYDRPSQQRALSEIIRFWSEKDPVLARTDPVLPGKCNGKPLPLTSKHEYIQEPDCIHASGCLWCEHHRDIDSQDYIWSLACFRHLKIIELSRSDSSYKSISRHPIQHVIDRTTEKLRWFKESSKIRREWVEEALIRVEEGSYHPNWRRVISMMEGER